MSPTPDRDEAARARNGYLIITGVRFGGIAMVMLGFAIVRGLIDLPQIVGAVIVIMGFIEFFFLPRFISRAWNAKDGRRP